MITLREQTKLLDDYIERLDLRETFTSMPVEQLGLNRGDKGDWWSSYYIGLAEINGQNIEVLPKLEDLDFMSLFSFALLYQPSSDYFSSCYDINWEKEIFASTELYN